MSPVSAEFASSCDEKDGAAPITFAEYGSSGEVISCMSPLESSMSSVGGSSEEESTDAGSIDLIIKDPGS